MLFIDTIKKIENIDVLLSKMQKMYLLKFIMFRKVLKLKS